MDFGQALKLVGASTTAPDHDTEVVAAAVIRGRWNW